MSETANREQIEGWNNAVGKAWTRFQKQLDVQHAPVGAKVLETANPRPGEHALDVGCGAGATTLDLAKAIGPEGRVTGVDISAPLLAIARAYLPDEDAAPIDWLQADAQTHAFQPQSFDLISSRFGVMFFDDPTAAFANLHAAMKPSGRLVFACWRTEQESPWLTLPIEAVEPIAPRKTPAPGAPGPFAFADPDRVRAILTDAGWRDVAIAPYDAMLGGLSLEETTRVMTRMGPAGAALREAGATPELMAAGEAAVRAAFKKYETPEGVVLTPGGVWMVTAKA
jgi:ubiquinone/menaquinone biosynthesis C-methylase UbiE